MTVAVAKTLVNEDTSELACYRNDLRQVAPSDIEDEPVTKFLVQLFTGGKAAASLVKFSKFYLVVDTTVVAPEVLEQIIATF